MNDDSDGADAGGRARLAAGGDGATTHTEVVADGC